MNRRALLILSLTAFASTRSMAQKRSGLSFPGVIDAAVINKTTGELRLALIIDRPVDDSTTADLVKMKLNTYTASVKSGNVYRQFPEASKATPVALEFLHQPARTEAGTKALQQLSVRASQLGFSPEFTVLP